MSRTLTRQELYAADVLGLVIGFDVDDEKRCPEQLCHVVTGAEHEQMRPICGATTLWFYGPGIPTDHVITCPACLAALPSYVRRAHRRLHLHDVPPDRWEL